MKSVRALSTISMAALVYAVAAASPVTAGAHEPGKASCNARTSAASGAQHLLAGRGGTGREPVLDERHEDLPAAAKGKAGKAFKATVPVYFHIVTDGAIGALTDAQVAAQMGVLNTTFAGGEGGDRSGFSFTLAGVTGPTTPAGSTRTPAAPTSTP